MEPRPQGWPTAQPETESKPRAAICSGRVQLCDAQQAIATDWATALTKLKIK
ncbi:hypothetical protein RM609_33770 [Streptomyces sp. DSM 40473]|uniref:Uncharacterized protein n=1 Tax=Streptomyces hesseae TaxID=3075519 RepID=A0ABU2T140_9ACTN|nr:hypothetical protein [Streptomyces sp. DSM 40473]